MTNPMVNYADIIAKVASEQFNVRDEYKNNTVEQNVEICRKDSRKFSVGVINVTGDLNIGMMLRSASLLGAENFYIFGRKKFDKRSTVGAENYINVIQHSFDDPISADYRILDVLRTLKHHIIACEQGGPSLGSIDSEVVYLSSTVSSNPLFLFGSESHGIPRVILDAPNYHFPEALVDIISIPQRGVLRSFNVSAAMNIVLWDYIRFMEKRDDRRTTSRIV